MEHNWIKLQSQDGWPCFVKISTYVYYYDCKIHYIFKCEPKIK